jgi:CRP-like cAMP-binding protein
MAARVSRSQSIRQSGARPPRPRAISAQDLGKLEGLAGLLLRKLEALRARMTVRQFSKHSIIYEQGQSERAVYIVLSGICPACMSQPKTGAQLARGTGSRRRDRDSLVAA